jgi:hypothetical protein
LGSSNFFVRFFFRLGWDGWAGRVAWHGMVWHFSLATVFEARVWAFSVSVGFWEMESESCSFDLVFLCVKAMMTGEHARVR